MDDLADPSDYSNMPYEKRTLVTLPTDTVHVIFSHLSFAEVSELRRVCRHFDRLGQLYLNHGFRKLCSFHSTCSKQLKAQLPRRESERRVHPLARHCDILSAVETRLSLLAMTYVKYIDMSLCCFIPGKVIDESYSVMHFVMKTPKPPRPHEILQELRDISSMAMEHFDEKVVPILKRKMPGVVNVPTVISSAVIASSSRSSDSGMQLQATATVSRFDFAKLENHLKRLNMSSNLQKKAIQGMKVQRSEDKKIIDEQGQKIAHQTQTVAELGSQVAAQELTINDLEHRLSEFSRQLSERLGVDLEGGCSEKTVSPRGRKRAAAATNSNTTATKEKNGKASGSGNKAKRSRRK